eukprot:m.41980 g.41980  ORF g.41980 m.41980 type:complete len:354 (-) comp10635_c0_seq1:2451-3512(-)
MSWRRRSRPKSPPSSGSSPRRPIESGPLPAFGASSPLKAPHSPSPRRSKPQRKSLKRQSLKRQIASSFAKTPIDDGRTVFLQLFVEGLTPDLRFKMIPCTSQTTVLDIKEKVINSLQQLSPRRLAPLETTNCQIIFTNFGSKGIASIELPHVLANSDRPVFLNLHQKQGRMEMMTTAVLDKPQPQSILTPISVSELKSEPMPCTVMLNSLIESGACILQRHQCPATSYFIVPFGIVRICHSIPSHASSWFDLPNLPSACPAIDLGPHPQVERTLPRRYVSALQLGAVVLNHADMPFLLVPLQAPQGIPIHHFMPIKKTNKILHVEQKSCHLVTGVLSLVNWFRLAWPLLSSCR